MRERTASRRSAPEGLPCSSQPTRGNDPRTHAPGGLRPPCSTHPARASHWRAARLPAPATTTQEAHHGPPPPGASSSSTHSPTGSGRASSRRWVRPQAPPRRRPRPCAAHRRPNFRRRPGPDAAAGLATDDLLATHERCPLSVPVERGRHVRRRPRRCYPPPSKVPRERHAASSTAFPIHPCSSHTRGQRVPKGLPRAEIHRRHSGTRYTQV